MERLGHKFGNDGVCICLPLLDMCMYLYLLQVFWISYEDLLKKYQHFDRTRLFGPEWTITQQWTSLNVPWSADYHSTKLMIDLTKKSPVVIVLSQVSTKYHIHVALPALTYIKLDTRYFKGLEGEYDFTLQFRLEKEGEEDYIVRSRNNYMMNRSVNTETTLEAGRYFVLMKITSYRCQNVDTPEEVIRRLASTRREKLVQIGLSYDLAHTKGLVVESEKEKKEREEREERHRLAERSKLREETVKKLQKKWIKEQKLAAREQRMAERQQAQFKQFHPSGSPIRSANSTSCRECGVQTDGSGRTSTTDGADEQVSSDVIESPRSIMKTTDGEGPSRRSTNGDAVHFNGVTNDPTDVKRPEKPTRPSVETHFTTDGLDDYERELLEGFEFDSDIDMPPEPPREVKDTRPRSDISSLYSDEAGNDPWNAVCVVGLRVYSKDPKLSLQVVRPIPEDDVEAPLDRDDPAASATKEKGSWSV